MTCPICNENCKSLDDCGTRYARQRGAALQRDADAGRLKHQRVPTREDYLDIFAERGGVVIDRESTEYVPGRQDILRDHLATIRTRCKAILTARASLKRELEQLTRDEEVLALRVEGAGMTEQEIATRMGLASHSSVVERLQRIEREATGATSRESVAVRCARPKCGNVVMRIAETGRPPVYCTRGCERAHNEAVRRSRMREAWREGGMVSPTGFPHEGENV